MIRFDLSITLDYNVIAPSDYVFIIQPTTTPYQRVTWEQLVTEPAVATEEELHASPGTPANRHLRARVEPGQFKLRYDAIVDVVHHFALPADLREVPIAELPGKRIFLTFISFIRKSITFFASGEFAGHSMPA